MVRLIVVVAVESLQVIRKRIVCQYTAVETPFRNDKDREDIELETCYLLIRVGIRFARSRTLTTW